MPEYGDEYVTDDGTVPDPSQPNDQRDDYVVPGTGKTRAQIRQLEENARKGAEAEQRALAAERRAAFAEAGIPLNGDAAQFFRDGYKGELTAEAIREKATAVGVLTPAATPPPPPEPPDTPLLPGEADFQQERRALAGGAPPDQLPDRDPYEFAREVYDKELEAGREWKHAFGTALNAVVNAGHRGDQRVIIPGLTPAAIGGGDVGSPPPGAGHPG
jgi:hypothetical protein